MATNSTSKLQNSYTFSDNNPIVGRDYYLLLQKDRDGKGTYSAILAIRKTAEKLTLISMFPKPAVDKVQLLLGNRKADSLLNITLQEIGGRTL